LLQVHVTATQHSALSLDLHYDSLTLKTDFSGASQADIEDAGEAPQVSRDTAAGSIGMSI
jgi:hypothetical protein